MTLTEMRSENAVNSVEEFGIWHNNDIFAAETGNSYNGSKTRLSLKILDLISK